MPCVRATPASERRPTRSSPPSAPTEDKGWAVGVPYSAATARTWLRGGGVTQRLCAAISSRPRSHVRTRCSFSHAGSPATGGWSGRPSPSWSPLLGGRQTAALLVWNFLWGAVPREGRHLVSSGGLVPAGTDLDTSLEQYVERLSHDRTTERHWQRLESHKK